MFKQVIKISVTLLAVLSFASVQALPMTGSVDFTASGTFVGAGSTPTGVDFDNPQILGFPVFTADGSIGTMAASAIPNGMEVFDFNLVSLPAIEWIISPVSVGGFSGNLIFEILSGGTVDSATPGWDDLEGSGVFKFECTPGDVACAGADLSAFEADDTIGTWRISNAGSILTVGFNVPAPATIGLLGLGLLGLGAIRRRRKIA